MRNIRVAFQEMISKTRRIAKRRWPECPEGTGVNGCPLSAVAVEVLVSWTEYLDLSVTQFLKALRKPSLGFKDPKARAREGGAEKRDFQSRDGIFAQPVSQSGLHPVLTSSP